MKNLLIITFTIILLRLPGVLYSQELNFVLESGLGSFQMSDLKEVNEISLKSLPFDAKITDDFPMYWNYKSSLLYTLNKFMTVGITCSFQSTGSRVSRTDYSGEYYFDTKIHSISPGAIAEFYYQVRKYRISLRNEAGVEFTNLKLTEFIRVNDQSQKDIYAFRAKNYYYYPAVVFSYPVSFLRAGLSAGYLFDLKSEDLTGKDPDFEHIVITGNTVAKSNWSGIRLEASVSFNLFQWIKPVAGH